MLRVFGFIIFAVLLVVLSFFAATHLTDVLNLKIGNFDVTMPYSVAAIGGLAIIGFFVLFDRLIRWFFDLPFISPFKRNVRRQAKSYTAINKGLVAVAAGDSKEALKQAKRAEKLGESNSLTHLLAAQAALSANDEGEAVTRYTELLKDKDTRLMGYRGLFSLAVNRGDYKDALAIAKRSFELHANSKWAFNSLFDLRIRMGDFDDALLLVPTGVKKQHLTIQQGHHLKAVLSTEIARINKLSGKNDSEIFPLLNSAYKEDPSFIPAILGLIRYYIDNGKKRKARQMIEHIWRSTPRPDLVPLWLEVQDETEAEKLYTAAKNFAFLNNNHEESRILVATYAINAKQWKDAESILNTLLSEHEVPQQRTLRLLAELEQRDESRQDAEKVKDYMLSMNNARAMPHWVCEVSGIPAKEWQAISPAGKFDGLRWAEAGEIIQNNALMLDMETSPNLLLSTSSDTLPYKTEAPAELLDDVVLVTQEGEDITPEEILAEPNNPNETEPNQKSV